MQQENEANDALTLFEGSTRYSLMHAPGTIQRSRTRHRWPDEVRVVGRDVSALVLLTGAIMIAPLGVALFYGEWTIAQAFLLAMGVTAAAGAVGYRLCAGGPEPRRRHGMAIAAVGWLAVPAFGMLPLVFAAYLTPPEVAQAFVPTGATYTSSLYHFRNPLHALLESMSAFTTTGLTMSVREPSVGHAILFYRSLAQWVGGAGMIVLALAILRTPRGTAGLSLYEAEGRSAKLRPNVVETARALWRIYVGLTLGVAVYLAAATFLLLPDYGIGPTLFDAVNHAMTGQSTGGFSTLDDSIAGYGSYAMELVYLPPMFLGAVALPLYYRMLNERSGRTLWQDPQFHTLSLLTLVGTPLLIGLLAVVPAVADPVREGLFQYVSALSTTGWQTSPIGDWGGPAILFIAFGAMVIGGSAGATVGGIKIIRFYLVARGVRWQVVRFFMPRHAMVQHHVGSRALSTEQMDEEVAAAASFTGLYVALLIGGALIIGTVSAPEFDLADALFESATAQGTVGLSAGITRPAMHPVAEVVIIVQMWIGRLEIIPVLVLLRAFVVGTRPGRR